MIRDANKNAREKYFLNRAGKLLNVPANKNDKPSSENDPQLRDFDDFVGFVVISNQCLFELLRRRRTHVYFHLARSRCLPAL